MINLIILIGAMSLQASIVILVILVCRKLFELVHISKKYTMLLWLLPFFFLICPWKITVSFGFWENAPVDYGLQYGRQELYREKDENAPTTDAVEQSQIEEWMGKQGGNVALGQTDAQEGGWFGTPKGQEGNHVPYMSNVGTGDKKTEKFEAAKGNMIPEISGGAEDDVISEMPGAQAVLIGCFLIWLIGVAVIAVHIFISYRRLRETLLCSVCEKKNVYWVDDIPVPMVFGLLRPGIYLPFGIAEEYLPYVIAHEQTHIRRKDPQFKMLAFLIAGLHWFNPLAWLAYYLMGKDMEMACDEETVQRLGMDNRKAYANALLQLSAGNVARRSWRFSAPVGFDEGNTKGRIKNIVKYQKTLKILAVVAVVAGVLLGIFFLTKSEEENAGDNQLVGTLEGGGNNNVSNEQNGQDGQLNAAGASQDTSDKNTSLSESKDDKTDSEASNSEATSGEDSNTGRMDANFRAPSETEVLALRRQVTAGMSEEEITRITENIKVANQTLEKAYFNDDIFEELSDPENLYWNYFDYTGDIQIGWKLKEDSPTYDTSYQMTYDEFKETYGEPVMTYNRFDADNFIELMTEMRDSMKSELAKRDFTMLIHNIKVAKDNRNVECLREAYYILHDLDYFLFRYGPSDVGMYVKDASTVSKFYGVLNAYDIWRNQYLYTDLDMDFNTTETVWTELREENGKLMHVVKVQMENGEEAEILYTVRNQQMGDQIDVQARIINKENRHNLVVFITDSTSNYASTDMHVLHLEKREDGIVLVEDLTILDGNEQAPEYETYKDTCLLTDFDNTYYSSSMVGFLSMVGWQSAIRIRGLQDGEEVFRFIFWDGSDWICTSLQGKSVAQGEETTADLDGDGSEETIRYHCRYASVGSWYVEAELMINGRDYIDVVQESLCDLSGCTSQLVENYRIVDIDSSDAYQEILIADAGPSGDPTISFYRFTGASLLYLGTVGTLGDQDYYLIPGDGTVLAANRVYWPENNGVDEIYFLEGDRLNKTETYTYRLTYERKHELLQDLPVYHLGDSENVATVLKAGEDTIIFTRIYEDGWILLKTGKQEEYAIYLDGGDEKWTGWYLPDGRYIDEVVADMSRAG